MWRDDRARDDWVPRGSTTISRKCARHSSATTVGSMLTLNILDDDDLLR
jgi:hypothetical protein